MKLKFIFLCFALCAVPAFAALDVWNGTHSGYWSDGENWSLGAAPADDVGASTGTPAIISRTWETTSYTIQMTGSQKIAGMRLAAGGYTLKMNDGVYLQLRAGTLFSTASDAISNTIDGTIRLNTMAGNGTIVSVSAGNELYVKTFDFSLVDQSAMRSMTTAVDGALTLDSFASADNIRILKTGTGTLALAGTSVATLEGVRVSAGTLSMRSAQALAASTVLNTNINTANAVAIMLDSTDGQYAAVRTYNSAYAGDGSGVTVGTNLTSGTVALKVLTLSQGSSAGDAVLLKIDGGATLSIANAVRNENATASGRQGGIRKIGSGTLLLNGAAFYTAGTTVSEGIMMMRARGWVDQDDYAGTHFDVTVSNGATFGCGLYIDGALTLQGGLATVQLNHAALGDDPVSFSMSALTMANGGKIKMDIGDSLVVTGALTVGEATTVTLDLSDNGAAAGTYLLVSFGEQTGWSSTDRVVTVNGAALDPSRYSLIDAANSWSILVIPEPSAFAFLGLLGCVFLMRRRR